MDIDKIAAEAADRWEAKAHAETYLDTKLQPKAKTWLVDEIKLAAIKYAATVPPAKASAANDARASTRASSTAIERPVEKPADTDDSAAMAALKGQLKGTSKGKQKGKMGASK